MYFSLRSTTRQILRYALNDKKYNPWKSVELLERSEKSVVEIKHHKSKNHGKERNLEQGFASSHYHPNRYSNHLWGDLVHGHVNKTRAGVNRIIGHTRSLYLALETYAVSLRCINAYGRNLRHACARQSNLPSFRPCNPGLHHACGRKNLRRACGRT